MRGFTAAIGTTATVLLAATASYAGTADAATLTVSRSDGMVTWQRGSVSSTQISSGDAIGNGHKLQTGERARISVQLDGGGQFTLGDDSLVTIDSSEAPDPPARATLLRLKLLLGALFVDTKVVDKNAPGDARVNAGALQLRIYGSQAWVMALPSGDEVCVLSGAVEIRTPDGKARIDLPGECLRWTAAGMQRWSPRQVGSMATRLERTTFNDDFPARYAAEQARKAGGVLPMLSEIGLNPAAPVAAAAVAPPPPAPAAAPAPAAPAATATAAPATVAATLPATAAAATGGWRIVLGSFAEPASARKAAEAWKQRGIRNEIVRLEVLGTVTHRVVSRRFPDREEATTALLKLRRKPKEFDKAWLVAD